MLTSNTKKTTTIEERKLMYLDNLNYIRNNKTILLKLLQDPDISEHTKELVYSKSTQYSKKVNDEIIIFIEDLDK